MPTYIRQVKTTGGFLQNAAVQLPPGLTCIIGSRGTCKSTLVETIRFAFNCNSDRIAALLDISKKNSGKDAPSNQGLITATLADGQVVCEISERSQSGDFTVTIERDVLSNPRVYKEGVKELSDTSLLNQVEIYSQGDLQLIAEKDVLRLELIDRPHKSRLDVLKTQRVKAAESLRELGPKIRAKRAEIESRKTEVLALNGLRTQLVELRANRPSLSAELDKERENFLKRKDLYEALENAIQGRNATLEQLKSAVEGAPLFRSIFPPLAEIGTDLAERMKDTIKASEELFSTARTAVDEALDTSLKTELNELKHYLEDKNARYYTLRTEQQTLNDTLKREDTLKQQITYLERIEAELVKLTEDVNSLFRRRQEARHAMRNLSDQIFSLRLKEVENINSRHGEVVILTLEQGARSDAYPDMLVNLLRGSNLRNQADVVRDLAGKVRPSDLVDVVEQSDANRLSSLLGRDLGQMTRLVSYLLDSSSLYDLEGVVFDDRLEITMYDEGTPKPVGQLSKGQMATALLPLILRNSDYPLIFDQPEDDLDNRFIYRTLVEIVRQLKQQRQLIFVTHNANIPVLGEADLVIVMRMESPIKAAPPLVGTVDEMKEHILTLLEGGKDAFLLRQKKYKDLLGT